MSSAIVLGLDLPNSSTRSLLRIPATNASIALSSDTCSAEFLMILHHWMYVLIDSSDFCLQVLSCYIDAGFLQVDQKFLTNKSSKVSQLSMDPFGSFFIQDLTAPLRWTWMLCIAVALVPPINSSILLSPDNRLTGPLDLAARGTFFSCRVT
jgi:hypothetical protein